MKKTLALGGLALAAHALPSLAAVPLGREIFRTVRRTQTSGKVGLTFDDGPEKHAVDQFLTVLEELGVRATFFLVGEQVAAAPSSALKIAEMGHEIACHGYRHRNHLRVSPWATIQDLRIAKSVIESETGRTIRLFRPPYGVFNSASWAEAGRQGWLRVLWSRWGKDWEARATADSICSLALKGISGGDIILLHDAERYSAPGSWHQTLAAVGPLVNSLRRMGLEPVPVGDLDLYHGNRPDFQEQLGPLKPPLLQEHPRRQQAGLRPESGLVGDETPGRAPPPKGQPPRPER